MDLCRTKIINYYYICGCPNSPGTAFFRNGTEFELAESEMKKLLLILVILLPAASFQKVSAQETDDELFGLFEEYGKTYKGFLFKNVTAILKMTAATMSKEDRAALENVKKLYAVSWNKCTPAVQAMFLADFQRKVLDWERIEDEGTDGTTVTLMYKKPEGGKYIANPVFLMDLKVKTSLAEGQAQVILYMTGTLPLDAASAFVEEIKPAA